MPKALQPLAADIWILDQPFTLLGTEIGTRTTIVRLADGGLWVHSPGPELGAAYRSLGALGPVRHLVAPNSFHHLFLTQAARLFPDATLWGPKSIQTKQPRLPIRLLDAAAEAAWGEDLLMQPLAGLRFEESLFLHRPSASLILTDLLLHLHPQDRLSQLLFALVGLHGRLMVEPLIRSFLLRDATALKASLTPALAWDFERIVLAHGRLVEVEARLRFLKTLTAARLLPSQV